MFFQYSIYVGLEIKYLRINPIQIRFIKDLSVCSKIWKKDCHIYMTYICHMYIYVYTHLYIYTFQAKGSSRTEIWSYFHGRNPSWSA